MEVVHISNMSDDLNFKKNIFFIKIEKKNNKTAMENKDDGHCRARKVALTWSKTDVTKEEALKILKNLGAEVAIVCSESHNDGSKHLHGYADFVKRKRFKPIDFVLPDGRTANVKPNANRGWIEYILKEDTLPSYYGIDLSKPLGQARKESLYRMLLKKEKTVEDFVNQHPTQIINYSKLKSNLQMYFLNTDKTEKISIGNLWLYGESGIGKTHSVYKKYMPNLFIKPQNKWWDGYGGQDYVLIDDLDTEVLGHYIKIWADKYKTIGEVKGGTVMLNYKRLIVTSNYTPEELFPDDRHMSDAIKRRFLLIDCDTEMANNDDDYYMLNYT